MKNILIILILLSMLILTTNSKAYDDCKMVCEDIPWQSTGSTPFTIPGCSSGCTFVAYWSYRFINCPEIAPIVWCDFKLDAIGCVGCPPSCWTCVNMYDMTHAAMAAVMLEEAKFKICATSLLPDSCSINFSINYSSCWKNESASPSEPTRLLPCDESQCCKEIWKICKDELGNPQAPVLVTQWSLNPYCESGECIAVCEPLHLQQLSGIQDNINQLTGYKASVYPNPTDGYLNIELKSESEGEHLLEIFDITGNLMLSKTFQKQDVDIQVHLDLTKFISGNYKYVIKLNGVSKISGTFNLIK